MVRVMVRVGVMVTAVAMVRVGVTVMVRVGVTVTVMVRVGVTAVAITDMGEGGVKTNKEDLVPKYLLKHLGITTQRQYKEIYRKRIRAVEKAFKEYWSGSAYVRDQEKDHVLLFLIKDRIKSLSQKEWGR